jgi:hypothetical protein
MSQRRKGLHPASISTAFGRGPTRQVVRHSRQLFGACLFGAPVFFGYCLGDAQGAIVLVEMKSQIGGQPQNNPVLVLLFSAPVI